MKLIKPSFEIIEQQPGYEGILKQIERVGRVSYKSEHLIKEGSAEKFVERMIKHGHGAVLEHGTVYLTIATKKVGCEVFKHVVQFYTRNSYSKVRLMYKEADTYAYITTNYRVIYEHHLWDHLDYLSEPTEHERRVCVKFVMDRVGSQSFCRHRVFSFLQESTRYCCYSLDKFNNEIKFIVPEWCVFDDDNRPASVYEEMLLKSFRNAEATYMNLLKQWEERVPDKRYKTGFRNNPWTAEQARAVLPGAIATELIMTGFVSDWWGETCVFDSDKHILGIISNSDSGLEDKVRGLKDGEDGAYDFQNGFFGLRCDSHAHPQARELAIPLRDEFVKRGLVL